MKTVYLIRHSLAAERHGSMPDSMRPLTMEGIQRINGLCEFLNKQGIRFDTIFKSHALRAFETALYVSEKISFPQGNIIRNKKLYNGDADTYLGILAEQRDVLSNAAIIGHNPEITDLANYFLNNNVIFLLPCGMVALQFMTDTWTDVCIAENKLLFTWTPAQ